MLRDAPVPATAAARLLHLLLVPILTLHPYRNRNSNPNPNPNEVYDAAVGPLVAGVLNGRSACVLAYGQTGSGKTHTMSGNDGGAEASGAEASGACGAPHASLGLAPRAVLALLGAIEERQRDGVEMTLKISCVEVFGERVTDLLHDGAVGGFWTGVAAAATAAGYADEVIDSATQAPGLIPTLSPSPILTLALTLALTPTLTLTLDSNP